MVISVLRPEPWHKQPGARRATIKLEKCAVGVIHTSKAVLQLQQGMLDGCINRRGKEYEAVCVFPASN